MTELVYLANQSEMKIIGSTTLHIQIGLLDVMHHFLITDTLTQQAILGLDFLEPHKCILDFKQGFCLIQGQKILFQPAEYAPQWVRALHDISVPPQSEKIIYGKVPLHMIHTEGYVDNSTQVDDLDLIVANALIQVDDNGTLPLRLANFSKSTIHIHAHQKLVLLHPISNMHSIQVILETTNLVSPFNNSPTLSTSALSNPTVSRDWVSEFNLSKCSLTPTQLKAVTTLLQKYECICSKHDFDVGLTSLIQHEIHTDNTAPIKQAVRKSSPSTSQEISNHIQNFLDQGIIENSNSPWSAPVVLVKKKNGSSRIVIDYRLLNMHTVSDSFPLPRIDQSLEMLGGNKYFCTLDLTSGFYQIPMCPEDKYKTAFATRDGLFQFTWLPMGLKNSPSTFQRLMHAVLNDYIFKFSLVYLNDVIIAAKTFEQTLERLEFVFERFKLTNLKIKPTKCQLFMEKISFLGHIISPDGIQTDPDKTEKVLNWPLPTNVHDIKSFLGLASYYRWFIRNFSKIAHPLYELETSKNFVWTDECQKAFQELKTKLTSPPILSYPDFTPSAGKFIIDCDASDVSLGAILSQIQDGKEVIIAYGSKCLNKAQQNYCTTQKELLALVYFLEYWRCYVIDKPFIIRTDHNALVWLNKAKSTNKMLGRWSTQLDEFMFEPDMQSHL